MVDYEKLEKELNNLWRENISEMGVFSKLEQIWDRVGTQYMEDTFELESNFIDFSVLGSCEQLGFLLWCKETLGVEY